MAISDFTGKNIQDTYQRVVQTDGTNLADGTGSLLPISFDGNNVIISGSLTATEYSVSSSVTNIVIATKSGSTAFGNSTDDTHTFTGHITASGDISASGTILANDFTVLDDIELSNNSKIFVGTDTTEIATQNDDGFIIKANGPEIMRMFSSGVVINEGSFHTVDFRVESNDDAHAFYIDSGLNTIELGRQTNTHVTASGNISSSGYVRALEGQFGDSPVAAGPVRDLEVRNSGTVRLRLESDSNANQLIEFRNNQEPDFTIGNIFNDGGFQIRSDNKTFITIGATGSLSGDPAEDTVEISGSVDISSNITASGNISSSGNGLNYFGGNIELDDSKKIQSNAGNYIQLNTSDITFQSTVQVAKFTNGEASFNDGGHSSQDFRVESDTKTHALFVDANENKVGIGRSSALSSVDSTLDVTGDLTVSSHITASGNISSSGNVLAVDIYASSDVRAVDGFFISDTQGGTILGGLDFIEGSLRLTPSNGNPAGIGIFVVSSSGGTATANARIGIGTESPGEMLTVMGNISSSGTIQANNFVDNNTRIKILPRDFVADDVGRPLMIEDDSLAGSNTAYLHSFGTSNAIAYVDIPFGYTATHVKISGSNTANNFRTYEGNIGSNVLVEKGGSTSLNTEKDITDVAATDSNYLFIYVSDSAGVTDEIFGGYVTITPS